MFRCTFSGQVMIHNKMIGPHAKSTITHRECTHPVSWKDSSILASYPSHVTLNFFQSPCSLLSRLVVYLINPISLGCALRLGCSLIRNPSYIPRDYLVFKYADLYFLYILSPLYRQVLVNVLMITLPHPNGFRHHTHPNTASVPRM